MTPVIQNPRQISLPPAAEAILTSLFADYHQVIIKTEFGGGFSGSRVLSVVPVQNVGMPNLPVVVKMAPAPLIEQEWQAYRQFIQEKFPGVAEIRGRPVFSEDGDWAGLRYALVGGGTFETESLFSYCHHARPDDIQFVLTERLFQGMENARLFSTIDPRFSFGRGYDAILPVNLIIDARMKDNGPPIPLLPGVMPSRPPVSGDFVQLTGFIVTETDAESQTLTLNAPDGGYRLRVCGLSDVARYELREPAPVLTGVVTHTRGEILRRQAGLALGDDIDLAQTTFRPNDTLTLPNPLAALPALLAADSPVRVSFIHGDLNLENILIDPAVRDVSLIDFALSRQDHLLHDLLRLETEIITKLVSEAFSWSNLPPQTIHTLYHSLHALTINPDQSLTPPLAYIGLRNAFAALVAVRKQAARSLANPADWSEYYRGLALYLLSALKFKNLDQLPIAPLPKQLAFWAAAVALDLMQNPPPTEPPAEESAAPDGRLTLDTPAKGLQPYLPFSLYSELSLNPTPQTIGQSIDHLQALLHTVQTYCVIPVRQGARPQPHNISAQWLDVSLLFADISGFTAMSEQLNARGRAGAEEITRIVNRYFTAMVDILHQNGGMLIKFGGDAMLGLFAGEARQTARYAAQTALLMQRAMANFFALETSVGTFDLKMSIGLHTGRVLAAHVGDMGQMEYWVCGSDVNRVAAAESFAQSGQIALTEATRSRLAGWLDEPTLPPAESADSLHILPAASFHRLPPKPTIETIPVSNRLAALKTQLDTFSPYLTAGLMSRLAHDPHHQRIDGEHRLVAVLFVNVSGFGQLVDALAEHTVDPVLDTMQDYFATMQQIIREHGGSINKTDLYTTGDKLLAIFGAPVAHEDDVDQAARAALAMQAALPAVNKRLAKRCPQVAIELRQRIGLSTGHVFSGNVGSEICQEYTIMGDEVNLAARLMSAAGWGDVLVSSHVYYWLAAFGQFEAKGEIALKGKKNPVPVYLLKHIGQTRRPKPQFVDRVQVFATLKTYLTDLQQHQGHIISLIGEPGIGKSRLLAELKSQAEARQMVWLTGQCRDGQPAYHLWADILRHILNLTPTDDAIVQRQVLIQHIETLFGPEQVDERGPFLSMVLGLPLPDLWQAQVEFQPENAPLRVVKETVDFLTAFQQERPLVLVCEDLHWIDEDSALILQNVIEHVTFSDMLVLFTTRPGQTAGYRQISGAMAADLRDWHTELLLGPLARADSDAIVDHVLGRPADPALRERVFTHSRGNPLFIAEIVRAAATMPDVTIPDKIHKIIESRVDALPEGPRAAIKAAAVIGETFSLDELMFVVDEPERAVRKHLAHLRQAQLIGLNGSRYEFSQPLAREIIYHGQTSHYQKAKHFLLVRYWADRHQLQTAARHAFAGTLWDEALRYSEQAAETYLHRYAHKEAVRLLRQALHAAVQLDDQAAQARISNQLGRVYFQLGEYPRAEQIHLGALSVWQALPAVAPAAIAETHWLLARNYDRWGKLDEALAHVAQGETLAADAPVIRARLLLVRCSALLNTKRLPEAEQAGLQALQVAQSVSATLEEASACNNLGAVYGRQRQLEQALAYHQQSLKLRRELGIAHDMAQSLTNIGTTLNLLNRFDDAEEAHKQSLAIRRRIGDRRGQGVTYHNLAWLYLDRRRPNVAEQAFKRALELWQPIDHRKGLAFVHNDLGALYVELGRHAEAVEHLTASARYYEGMGADVYLPENYVTLAQAHLALGQHEQASAAARQAMLWAERTQDTRQMAAAQKILTQIRDG